MKKIFCFVAAALVSLSALAVDGVNVMASGLKATFNDDVTEMTINYVLNTPATSLDIEFYDADNEIVASIEDLTADSLLAAGAHRLTIEIPVDDLEEGTFTWGIHAYGAATVFENKLPVGDPKYSFYLPQDVVVDNSFESDYFGRIYVSESCDGLGQTGAANIGGSVTTQNQTRGIFIYDQQLNLLSSNPDSALVGYEGGITGGDRLARSGGFKRLAIDEQGYLYIGSRDETLKGVYRMDPAAPQNNFVQVLAGAYAVDALDIVGSKMYTIEDLGGETGGQINTYDMTTVPVGAPSKTWVAGELNLVNSDESIRSDRNEGFWIVQHRYAPDVYPALTHLKKNGARDYQIDGSHNTDLLSNTDGGLSYRGTLGVSLDGSLIAISSNRRAVVFAVQFGDSIKLTKVCETPAIGGNIDGIAFDAADNLYVASASAEQFHMYPISKGVGENNCLVLAPSKYAFTIEEPTTEEAIVYDVAQAIAAADSSTISENDSIIVRGVITKIEFKGTNFSRYGSANIYVADATGAEGSFEFYNCYSMLADTFRTSDPAYDATSSSWTQFQSVTDGNGVTVHVGDTVIAEGKYKKYNTTYELNTGCYLIDIKPFVEEAPERELTKVGFHFPELNQPADNNIEMVGSFEEGTMDMEKIIETGWFLTYSFIHAAEEETFKFRDKTNTDMVLCKKVGDNWVQAIFTFGDLWNADTWHGDACMLIELDIHDSELYAWMEGMPEPEPEVTAVENVVVNTKAQKVMIDGVLYIVRDNKMYNVQGAELK